MPYRFNLNRHLGRAKGNLSKSEADRAAEDIRTAIRAGTFVADRKDHRKQPLQPMVEALTFAQFADYWKTLKGYQLVRPEDNASRIKTISNFVLPSGERFGDKDIRKITSRDIENFRASRKASGLSAVTTNHDLKLLRKMWNWGIRVKLEAEAADPPQDAPVYGLSGTPFRVGGVAFISIEKETPRNERFSNIEDEERLLALADCRMRAFITTMLDTCTRPGELRTLQWGAVDLERRVVKLKAAGHGQRAKTKTQVGRTVPLSARAAALLELRQYLPDGQRMPETAYVFGNEIGDEMSKSVLRNAWERLRHNAAQVWKDTNGKEGVDLKGLHLADLRHEGASRFDELNIPTAQIKEILGHADLKTTTRYVNPSQRAIRMAMDRLDASHLANSLQKGKAEETDSEKTSTRDLAVSLETTIS